MLWYVLVGLALGMAVMVGGIGVLHFLEAVGSHKRKAAYKKELGLLPFDRRAFLDPDNPTQWKHDPTGVVYPRFDDDDVSFATFQKYIEVKKMLGASRAHSKGGFVEVEPVLDLTPPEDPFGLDGGFLNATDLEDEDD